MLLEADLGADAAAAAKHRGRANQSRLPFKQLRNNLQPAADFTVSAGYGRVSRTLGALREDFARIQRICGVSSRRNSAQNHPDP